MFDDFENVYTMNAYGSGLLTVAGLDGAEFDGAWSNGKAFSGGWRPIPGREGPGNTPYDVSGHRASS